MTTEDRRATTKLLFSELRSSGDPQKRDQLAKLHLPLV